MESAGSAAVSVGLCIVVYPREFPLNIPKKQLDTSGIRSRPDLGGGDLVNEDRVADMRRGFSGAQPRKNILAVSVLVHVYAN